MICMHHQGQPVVETDQPFIMALQFNDSSVRIEISLADEFVGIMRMAFSLVPIFEAGGSVGSFVHISRSNDIINMNLCCIIEIWIFWIGKGLEYLLTHAWIDFINHFLWHSF